MHESDRSTGWELIHRSLYNPKNDIYLGIQAGVLKSLYREGILTREQLEKGIELLVEQCMRKK